MAEPRTEIDRVSLADLARTGGGALLAGTSSAATFMTGFTPLDEHLGGGLREGELTLIGGAQALGKTTFALQMARNVVAAHHDANVVYFCYEHPPQQLLERLVALESALLADPYTLAADDDALARALEAVTSYGDRLHVVRARGGRTGLPDIADVVRQHEGRRPVVFVDYLQKVFVDGMPGDEAERVTRVVEGLKELSLEFSVPVVAIVAADRAGVGPGRTRIHHLRGSTALLYESDVVLMLNNKWQIVSRAHLMYGAVDADRFKDYVVCTVEKNRNGRSGVDMEFRAHFDQSRFDPAGTAVAERLIDDRIVQE